MTDYNFTVIGIAVAFLVAVAAGIYKVANHRLSIYREWMPQRLGNVSAGLNELALSVIYELHNRIVNEFNYDPSEGFWPSTPPQDPTSLQKLIKQYTRAIRYKESVEIDVRRLMTVGGTMVGILFALAIGGSLISIHHSNVVESQVIAISGYCVFLFASFLGIVALILHVVLKHKLGNAEILSNKRASSA